MNHNPLELDEVDAFLLEVENAIEDACADQQVEIEMGLVGGDDIAHDVFQSLLWSSSLNTAGRREAARRWGYGGKLSPRG